VDWQDAVGATVVLGSIVLAVVVGDISVAVVCLALVVVAALAVRRVVRAYRTSEDTEAKARRELAQLFAASPIPQSISRASDDIILSVNPAYQSCFGVREADIVGKRPADVGIVFPTPMCSEPVCTCHPSATTDVWITTPAGEHEVLMSKVSGLADGVEVMITSFVDVTERNTARRDAMLAEGRMREVLENIEEVTWLADQQRTRTLYVNPAYETVYGRSVEALYADGRDWLNAVHPDDREAMEKYQRSADGSGSGRYRIIRPDGAVRWIEFRMFPILDASGTVVRHAGVATDITDRLALEEQLRQTQKLESIGLLAGGVAHDFNNVLAVISANFGLLAETIPSGSADHELVEEIDLAVARATGLTRQLLAFSRKQPVEPTVLNLNDAVKDTRKMLRRMVGEDIVITTSLDPNLDSLVIDPGYLVQVLMNLAVNARDAMPRGGMFALTTRNLADTGEVMLEVSDTGIGMSPQVKARVFEPFFTTKEHGRGTGLGLSVVHGIVQQAGGRIELDSVLGSGTTFRFYFPASKQPVDNKADVTRLAPAGDEKILVVDDDVFVRTAAARSLRARGYTVVEARDGFEAMSRLREHTGISLIVTDVIMPGLDGGELARLARAECPTVKILFTSGYTDDALADHGISPTSCAFLEKPFGTYALAGKVREVIDAA